MSVCVYLVFCVDPLNHCSNIFECISCTAFCPFVGVVFFLVCALTLYIILSVHIMKCPPVLAYLVLLLVAKKSEGCLLSPEIFVT